MILCSITLPKALIRFFPNIGKWLLDIEVFNRSHNGFGRAKVDTLLFTLSGPVDVPSIRVSRTPCTSRGVKYIIFNESPTILVESRRAKYCCEANFAEQSRYLIG